MNGGIVYFAGTRGGVGKIVMAHAACLGAILHDRPAVYVLTDPLRELREKGRLQRRKFRANPSHEKCAICYEAWGHLVPGRQPALPSILGDQCSKNPITRNHVQSAAHSATSATSADKAEFQLRSSQECLPEICFSYLTRPRADLDLPESRCKSLRCSKAASSVPARVGDGQSARKRRFAKYCITFDHIAAFSRCDLVF